MVTRSPASVVSAVMLGDKLRTLLSSHRVTEMHSVLTTESRVRMIVDILHIYLASRPSRLFVLLLFPGD